MGIVIISVCKPLHMLSHRHLLNRSSHCFSSTSNSLDPSNAEMYLKKTTKLNCDCILAANQLKKMQDMVSLIKRGKCKVREKLPSGVAAITSITLSPHPSASLQRAHLPSHAQFAPADTGLSTSATSLHIATMFALQHVCDNVCMCVLSLQVLGWLGLGC